MHWIFISKALNKQQIRTIFQTIITLLTFTTEHAAAQVTLNFDDLPVGTSVTTQYSSRGVVFKNASISTHSTAASGTQVIRASGDEFHTGPFVINFLSKQKRIRFLAGTDQPGDGTLRAFDTNNNLVAQDGPKTVVLNSYTTVFEVSVATPSIVRLEFKVGVSTFESFDNLELYGESSGPLPTAPPMVQINIPTLDQQFTNPLVILSGVITGEAVVGAWYKVRSKQPKESQAPKTAGGALQLSGSGNQLTFSMSYLLGLGPLTFTVTAKNTASLSHTDSVQATYLPQAIRDRVAIEGEVTLGDFLFGGGNEGSSYVVYEQAAIGLIGDKTYVVRGAILEKWLTERDQNGYPNLGCPTSEERNISGEDIVAQDFKKARIYADASGTYQVPSVFVEAIDARGGEIDIGIPIEDPRESTGAMQTWLFQRFRRPGRTEHNATLEIRGSPPRLYVERVANYPSFSLPIPQSPTIVEDFPCSDRLGPCDFSILDEQPIENIGQFCNNEKYNWPEVLKALLGKISPKEIDVNPPEWKAIRGDYVQTPLRGIITEAFLSIEDNPFTHENGSGCIADPVEHHKCISWLLGLSDACCGSDWHINVAPLPGWRNLIGNGPGSNPNYSNKIPVEYERGHARAFIAWGGDSRVGDLIFVSGRWVVDCGHDYKTEIHPPSVVANMRTLPNRPETFAVVWVNGFYSGDPVRLDIHPPPRPSPDATLNVLRQDAKPGPIDVIISDSIIDGQYLRLSFTASSRRVEVTPAGEMKFEPGRDYKGKFWIYWKTKEDKQEVTVTFHNIKRLKLGNGENGTAVDFIFDVNGQRSRFPAQGTVNLGVGQNINPNSSITLKNLTSASNLQLTVSARKGSTGFGDAKATYKHEKNFGKGEHTTFIKRKYSIQMPSLPGEPKRKPIVVFENLFELTYRIDVAED